MALLTDAITALGVHDFPTHLKISKPVTGTIEVSSVQFSVSELLVDEPMDNVGDAGGCG